MTPTVALAVRSDAYVASFDKGVHIATSHGRFTLHGDSISAWMDALLPTLDGSSTLADITSGLPAAHADLAASIIQRLVDVGVVHEVEEPVGQPEDGESVVLGYQSPRPRQARQAHRDRPVGVIAPEPWSSDIVTALRRSGVERVDRGLPDSDRGLAVEVVTSRDLEPARWAGRSVGDGIATLTVVVDGPDVVVLPDADPDDPDRLDLDSYLRRRQSEIRPEQSTSDVHRAAVVAQVARTCLVSVVGSAARERRVQHVTPELTTTRHYCPTHPFGRSVTGPSPEELATTVKALETTEPESVTSFAERVVRGTDDSYGLVRMRSDDATPQSPLHVAEADVFDPLGPLDPPGGRGDEESPPTPVRAVGFDYAEVRTEAARRALARYAGALVDARLLETTDGSPLAPPDTSPDALAGLVRAGASPGEAFVWGVSLSSGAAVRLDATTVFPRLSTPDQSPWSMPERGLGSGSSWTEAVLEGLASHWRHDDTFVTDVEGRAVSIDPGLLDEESLRCWTFLTELGQPPEILDHGGQYGLHRLTFRLGTATVATSAGDLGSAMRRGLLDSVHIMQRWWHRLDDPPPGYDNPPRPGPVLLVDDEPGPTTDDVVMRLAEAGHATAVVPLHHDPVLTELLPHTVRVVINRE